jgi:hypothetical protein
MILSHCRPTAGILAAMRGAAIDDLSGAIAHVRHDALVD